ncbi:MAG: hypothetical protein Q8Q26_05235 [Pseudorhodobacter sp.]|nr:hypothetical protein [Pseudorhodobacter sp.]
MKHQTFGPRPIDQRALQLGKPDLLVQVGAGLPHRVNPGNRASINMRGLRLFSQRQRWQTWIRAGPRLKGQICPFRGREKAGTPDQRRSRHTAKTMREAVEAQGRQQRLGFDAAGWPIWPD